MIIRSALSTDAESIKLLLNQLGYDLNLDQIKQRILIYSHQSEYINYFIDVAEVDNKVVGFISVLCYEFFVWDHRLLQINTLIVDKHYRNLKIGQKLVTHAENIAKKYNCKIAEVITLNTRKSDGTHRFYENLGYQDQSNTQLTYFSKKI